jgi:hypothetical protein
MQRQKRAEGDEPLASHNLQKMAIYVPIDTAQGPASVVRLQIRNCASDTDTRVRHLERISFKPVDGGWDVTHGKWTDNRDDAREFGAAAAEGLAKEFHATGPEAPGHAGEESAMTVVDRAPDTEEADR